MSDTPPDQKEAGDAPEAPCNVTGRFIMWMSLALGLYVLSVKPVVWLVGSHALPAEAIFIYGPFIFYNDDLLWLLGHYIDGGIP